MKQLDDREKELLKKLKEASLPENLFTLVFKINDIVLEERIFPADKYSLQTLSETRTHFLMNDLIREILKTFSETEKNIQEEIKKKQIEKLWKDNENNKNK